MGHLKMKPVGAPLIPAPTKLSLRMTPDGSSGRSQLGAGGDTITGGLSCVPFLSLGMPYFDEPPEGVTFRYVLPVNEETETCGECIEWVLTEFYDAVESGAEEPEVTIIAADDCRGLIVDITFPDGYESIYQYWVFAVRPFINGHRFGFDTGFAIEISPSGGGSECLGWNFEGIHGAIDTDFSDPANGSTLHSHAGEGAREFTLRGVGPFGDLTSYDMPGGGDESGFLWNVTIHDPVIVINFANEGPGAGTLELSMSWDVGDPPPSGTLATIEPTINGESYCGPITVEQA